MTSIAAQPLISVPGYDAEGYFVLDDQKILGFRSNTDSETTAWMDAGMKALQDEIDALLPDTVNTLSPGTHNATPLVLVDAYSDVQDHLYLLYHRQTKQLWKIAEARPQLDKTRMSRMSMVQFLASRGYIVLQQISPLHNAGRITQPVLLAYGTEDARGPFSEGRKFYQALAATNRTVEWLAYTPSVEDAKTQANRIDLWRRIETFLDKNIGRGVPGP